MPALESFLPALLQNFANLSPIQAKKIYPNQQGVKYCCGKYKRSLKKPGLYTHLAFLQDIEIADTMGHSIDLPNQTIETVDGEAVTVSAGLEYDIADLRLHYERGSNFLRSVSLVVRTLIRKAINSRTRDELRSETPAFDYLDEDMYKRLARIARTKGRIIAIRNRMRRSISEWNLWKEIDAIEQEFQEGTYEEDSTEYQECQQAVGDGTVTEVLHLPVEQSSDSEEEEGHPLRLTAEEEVLHALKGYAMHYGIRIVNFGLTDCVKARPIRLIQDTDAADD